MITSIRQLPPEEAIRVSVRSILGRLDGRRAISEELFDVTEEALGALPLTTDEFGRLTACVRNARRYLSEGERGAAKYELRLLSRRFCEQNGEVADSPKPHPLRTVAGSVTPASQVRL